jgi:hypothetical protein
MVSVEVTVAVWVLVGPRGCWWGSRGETVQVGVFVKVSVAPAGSCGSRSPCIGGVGVGEGVGVGARWVLVKV